MRNTTSAVRNRNGAARAYERLRAEIVSGRLQPNERLVEADLIQLLGAGRSAVRTALVRLEQEGLVEHEHNRGAKVRFVDEQEAAEILESRMVLEGLAARYAARNATAAQVDELRDDPGADAVAARRRRPHRRLRPERAGCTGACSRSRTTATVARLVATLNSQLVRFQYRTILLPGRAEQSHAEHRAIVDAVARGDPDAAEQAVRDHLVSHRRGAARPASVAEPEST